MRRVRFSLVAFLPLVITLFTPRTAFPCTTIIVGKALTRDGVVMHAHNEDMGIEAAGRLWYVPSQTFAPGKMVELPYEKIPQAEKTFAYWASGNTRNSKGLGIAGTERPYDDILVGINEHGVSLACNWANSRDEIIEGRGIRRYAIRQLVLERAATAEHAANLIGNLIETYGQADWSGLIFTVADAREGWIVETTTRQWVARRVRDDEIWVTANQYRIGSDWNKSSAGLMLYAKEKGFYPDDENDFRFRNVYGHPDKLDKPYDTDREQRVLELLGPKKGHIDEDDLFAVLRDRYEGTPKFTSPQTFEVWRDELSAHPNMHRPINTNLAQSSFVAVLRPGTASSLGPIYYFAMGTPSYSEYVPIYVTSRKLTPAYAYGDGAPSPESAWWTFRNLQRVADRDDEKNQPRVAKALANYRSGLREHVDEVEDQARSYLRSGREKEAFALLEAMSQSEAEGILTQVKTLTAQIEASTTKAPTNAVLPGTGGCAHCSILETGQSPKGVFAGALFYGLVFFVRRRRAARKHCPVAI